MPEHKIGLDPRFEGRHAQLLETRALVPGERLRELGQRAPAPERERLTQQLSRLPGIALRERAPTFADGTLESDQVELVLAHLEHVAWTAGMQPRLGKRLPQLRDVNLHHLLSRVRHVLAPEGVDDLLAGDGTIRIQQQHREERPLLACHDLQRDGTIERLQRAEEPKIHLTSTLSLSRARPFWRCEAVDKWARGLQERARGL